MRLSADGGSDVGLVRARNEDAHLVAVELGLFVVCDGVGGRPAGEVASATAAATIEAAVRAGLPALRGLDAADLGDRLGALLLAAFEGADAALRRLGGADPAVRGLSTTASALLVVDELAALAHVGDARIYRLRGPEVRQLTVDHTYAAWWARRGGAAPASAARYPGLAAALGLGERAPVDVQTLELAAGDRFLLCTDGLHAHLGDDAAIRELAGGPLAGVIPRALALARAGGGRDNITAVIVACDG